MTISTLTDKGQTTVPLKVREALKIKPRQHLEWTIKEDGSVVVRPQSSALDLFGLLKSPKRYVSLDAERTKMQSEVAKNAANEHIK